MTARLTQLNEMVSIVHRPKPEQVLQGEIPENGKVLWAGPAVECNKANPADSAQLGGWFL